MTTKAESTTDGSTAAASAAEALPQLTMAPIPVQTQTLRWEERVAKGKALRNAASRAAQKEWRPPANRADPVDLLIDNSKGRLPFLIPLRYGRMMATPFTFYRGAAAVMAHDLLKTSATGMTLVANGDCHLLDFGGFATAERKIIFDLNDFDEVSIAPWEWDVKRLVASFVVAGRSNGFAVSDCQEAAWFAAQAYRCRMAEYSEMPVLDAWHDAYDIDTILAGAQDKKMKRFYARKLTAATEQSAHEKEFAKLTFMAGDTPRIVDQPPLIFHWGDKRDQENLEIARATLQEYRRTLSLGVALLLDRFAMVDVAVKVVGVGSVGTVCGVILLMSGKGEPLFLQFKQARQSVLEPYCGDSPYAHAGQRIVVGQRALQAAGDMFLGWTTSTTGESNHYFVRRLSDAKIKPVVEIMRPVNLKTYAGLCGRVLAQAHARAADPLVLSSYMGKSTAFEDALAGFGVAYADQNERDHAALVRAVRAGRIEAHSELSEHAS
jgi:uncharacterized protein (DUF2252 family)